MSSGGDVEWVESDVRVVGLDERMMLRLYRFCKSHWEFWVGLLVGVVLIVFVIK